MVRVADILSVDNVPKYVERNLADVKGLVTDMRMAACAGEMHSELAALPFADVLRVCVGTRRIIRRMRKQDFGSEEIRALFDCYEVLSMRVDLKALVQQPNLVPIDVLEALDLYDVSYVLSQRSVFHSVGYPYTDPARTTLGGDEQPFILRRVQKHMLTDVIKRVGVGTSMHLFRRLVSLANLYGEVAKDFGDNLKYMRIADMPSGPEKVQEKLVFYRNAGGDPKLEGVMDSVGGLEGKPPELIIHCARHAFALRRAFLEAEEYVAKSEGIDRDDLFEGEEKSPKDLRADEITRYFVSARQAMRNDGWKFGTHDQR